VSEQGSLKIGRRQLAAQLRRLRELSNLTGDEVAEQLGWSGSKISRIELNRTEVKSGDLGKLLDLYGVAGAHRAGLLALAQAPRSKGWWEAYSDVIQPDYAAYIELEAEAAGALCWSPQLVHGLLQTPGYARAAIELHLDWTPTIPPSRIRQVVEVRMARQQHVTGSQTLALSVVLDESVLLRQMGDATVMRLQLEHLVQVSRLPNVLLRVLPLAGRHPIGTGSFALLTFPPVPGIDPPADVVYVEQLTRNMVYTGEATEAYEYRVAFEHLTEEALDSEQSRELIANVARETWS
jgi:transcriptional regulator with XRE-family HTH domain